MKRILSSFQKNKKIYLTVGAVCIFAEILFGRGSNSLLLLILLLYWMFLGVVYRLDEKYFFAFAIFFLILSVIPFLLGNYTLAEGISVWEFLFLILGLCQWVFLGLPFFKRRK